MFLLPRQRHSILIQFDQHTMFHADLLTNLGTKSLSYYTPPGYLVACFVSQVLVSVLVPAWPLSLSYLSLSPDILIKYDIA